MDRANTGSRELRIRPKPGIFGSKYELTDDGQRMAGRFGLPFGTQSLPKYKDEMCVVLRQNFLFQSPSETVPRRRAHHDAWRHSFDALCS